MSKNIIFIIGTLTIFIGLQFWYSSFLIFGIIFMYVGYLLLEIWVEYP